MLTTEQERMVLQLAEDLQISADEALEMMERGLTGTAAR